MHLALRPDLKKFVDQKVESGAYASADEVVASALARWKAEEQVDPAELRRLVAEGQAEADRGELLPADDVFAEIRKRSQDRRAT
jgi:putative addiction module CopG family antidote